MSCSVLEDRSLLRRSIEEMSRIQTLRILLDLLLMASIGTRIINGVTIVTTTVVVTIIVTSTETIETIAAKNMNTILIVIAIKIVFMSGTHISIMIIISGATAVMSVPDMIPEWCSLKILTTKPSPVIVHSMNRNGSAIHIPNREILEFQGLIDALFQCCQERMQYQSERFGLPEAELRCLLQFQNERYLTAKAIAGRLNVAKSRVTKIVDGLLRRKLVERTDDPDDSRIKLLKLTTAGEKQVVEIVSFRREMHTKVLDQFSLEQRSALFNGLSQLKRSMEAVKDMLV